MAEQKESDPHIIEEWRAVSPRVQVLERWLPLSPRVQLLLPPQTSGEAEPTPSEGGRDDGPNRGSLGTGAPRPAQEG